MTNQEAISVLESINAKTDYFLINDDARAEAFDMAISALEARDAPDTNVDTISRQVKTNYCKTTADEILLIGKAMEKEELMMLPSAQPEERTETHACDLIERRAARLAKCPFDGLNDYQRGWNDACDAIADNAPSAQLELANNSPKVEKENGE